MLNQAYKKSILWFYCIAMLMFNSLLVAEKPEKTEVNYSLFDSNGVSFDKKLSEIFKYKNGIFIEAGAHDGIQQSNTKRLEQFESWSGILVEPSKALYRKLQKNRPKSKCFQCALGTFEEDNTYIWGDFNGSLMSSVNGIRLNRRPRQKVLVRSLQSILEEVGISHVDFFSLDTEGYEYNILQGIDFNKTTFDYLLIEIYTTQYEDIVSFLEINGYDLIENFSNYNKETNPDWDGTHNDYFFKRRDLKDTRIDSLYSEQE